MTSRCGWTSSFRPCDGFCERPDRRDRSPPSATVRDSAVWTTRAVLIARRQSGRRKRLRSTRRRYHGGTILSDRWTGEVQPRRYGAVIVSEAETLFGQEHVRRYRETDGAVGHIWKRGSKTLLLTTSGRRTGKPTTTPLIYEEAGDNYVVVASQGGAPEHPGWYRNLMKTPEVEVQVEGDVFIGVARTAAARSAKSSGSSPPSSGPTTTSTGRGPRGRSRSWYSSAPRLAHRKLCSVAGAGRRPDQPEGNTHRVGRSADVGRTNGSSLTFDGKPTAEGSRHVHPPVTELETRRAEVESGLPRSGLTATPRRNRGGGPSPSSAYPARRTR